MGASRRTFATDSETHGIAHHDLSRYLSRDVALNLYRTRDRSESEMGSNIGHGVYLIGIRNGSSKLFFSASRIKTLLKFGTFSFSS